MNIADGQLRRTHFSRAFSVCEVDKKLIQYRLATGGHIDNPARVARDGTKECNGHSLNRQCHGCHQAMREVLEQLLRDAQFSCLTDNNVNET